MTIPFLMICWVGDVVRQCVVQPPVANVTPENRPVQPGGKLADSLGAYLTIEGVQTDATWQNQHLLSVEKLNGSTLQKPIVVEIKNLKLDKGKRYVLKGYENGKMAGDPPARREAAKEAGRSPDQIGVGSQVAWQWSVHFVVLRVVEPKGVKVIEGE